jgi:ketosteroid isomerase-like protein
MASAEQELVALYHEWMTAGKRKDMATLDRILGPEYTYTSSGQGRQTRQQWMDTVAVYDLESFTFVKIDVRLYGDMAVAFLLYQQTAILNGEPRSGEFLITDVWVRRDGTWQVVARSSIMMPEGS